MCELELNIDLAKYDTFDYKSCNFIDHLECEDLDYNHFFTNYMLKNWPCIIKNVSSTWECSQTWLTDSKINYDFFIKNYGDLEAPVANCNEVNFNAHCKTNMKVNHYMEYLMNNKREMLLYLKDWHLRRMRPDDTFYKVPFFFASDWLNEFAVDNNDDDFMFVYIGPQESWTPLHADVYNSYSWSVNVVGKKKWILFPPGEEQKLKDSLGNLPLYFNCDGVEDVKYFEIIQEQGDALFVPSGWYHQVVNLLDTISINHNWINACNIECVWKALQNSLSSVEHEIEEFKNTEDFLSQCQLILKSVFGMDVLTFITFLCYIGKKRLTQLAMGYHSGFDKYYLGEKHIRFDLKIISKVIDIIIADQTLLSALSMKKTVLDIKDSVSKVI